MHRHPHQRQQYGRIAFHRALQESRDKSMRLFASDSWVKVPLNVQPLTYVYFSPADKQTWLRYQWHLWSTHWNMVADGEEDPAWVPWTSRINPTTLARAAVFFLSLLVPCNKYGFMYLNTLKMIRLECIPESLWSQIHQNQKTKYRDHPPRKYFYQSLLLYSQVPTVWPFQSFDRYVEPPQPPLPP